MTVLILTPLPLEYAAISKHLEGVREQVFQDAAGYEIGYFKGKSHQYKVVVREPGMRNVDMALATEKAIQHFKPQIVLLVGIAGGVKDVEIGDLLIANKAYGYESGKETPDGFKARPAVESFSPELLARAQALSRKTAWKNRTDDGAPEAKVFIGAIAAGEKVVAGVDNPTFERIKLHLNDTLGLEMEAIGFATALHIYRNIHGLVIRGISDLCAGKAETDQQNWQTVAAARAAAFAFELLYELDAAPFIVAAPDPNAIAQALYALAFPNEPAENAADTATTNAALQWIRTWFAAADPISSAVLDLPGSAEAKQIILAQKLPNLLENAQFKAELEDKMVERRKLSIKNMLEDSQLEVAGNVRIGDQHTRDSDLYEQKNIIKTSTIKVGGDFHLGDGA